MIVENGVYVLQTYGPEYRVVYAQGIDTIYGQFNEETNHWAGDSESIVYHFSESPVFTELEQAWDYALNLAEQYEYLDDGVCLITDFAEKNFADVTSGNK